MDEGNLGEIRKTRIICRTGSLCGPYENIPEENAEEILDQLRKAGKEAADRLAIRKPNVSGFFSKFIGFSTVTFLVFV